MCTLFALFRLLRMVGHGVRAVRLVGSISRPIPRRILPMNRVAFVLFLLTLSPVLLADGFRDDFSDPKLETRQALRGDWKFEGQQASCVSDPELYKKYANHGPILRWPCELTDGTCEFEFQAKDCQRIVFTFNDKGHVFRVVLGEEKNTKIFGWIGQSSKENKPHTIAKDGVPKVSDLNGKWTKFKLVMTGDQAKVEIGDYSESLQHESIARTKGEMTISFAFGEMAIRNVALTSNE